MRLMLAVLLSTVINGYSQSVPQSSMVGRMMDDFRLRNVDGRWVTLSNYPDAKGFIIVFTCNHCPFAKLYPKRLNALHQKYKRLHVPLIAINSMDSLTYEEETFALMQVKARNEGLSYPYLWDVDQTVGRAFGASYTPQVFVLWKKQSHWVVEYSGAIDDNGEHPEIATSYVKQAVDALLHNQPVMKKETRSIGCRIYYRKSE